MKLSSYPLAAAAVLLTAVACGNDTVTADDPGDDAEAPGTGEGAGEAERTADEPQARAALEGPDGEAVGEVTFAAHDDGTRVTVDIDGIDGDPGFRGFHVHANDDPDTGEGCTADPDEPSDTWFESADGHLADGAEPHADHRGDMPSLLVADDATASADFVTDRFTPEDVDGAAVIVHAEPDNFGQVPTGDGDEDYAPNSEAAGEETEATGNAGDRHACGVIEATDTRD